MKYFNKNILTTSLAAAAIIASSPALSAGFALKEQSAYGQGSSFAGVAAGGAISTSFWNPANIGEVEGSEFEGMLSIISGKTNIETTGTSNFIYRDLEDSGNTSGTSAIPAIYYAKELNEKSAWGLSLTAPFGTSSEVDRGSKSQYVSLKSEAAALNLSPTFSYDMSDNLTVGAGFMFQKIDLELARAIPVGATVGRFSASDPVLSIKGDGSAIGATVGISYKNGANAFGVGYRSALDHEIDGKLTVAALGLNADINLDLETPSSLNIGYKRQVSEKLNLGLTFNKTAWSSVGTIPIISSATGSVATLGGRPIAVPLEYKDSNYYSFGGEYASDSSTIYRAGIGLDETTVSDNTRTTQLPDNDRLWLSFGLSKDLKSGLAVDFGYTYVKVKNTAVVNIGPGHASFSGLPYTGQSKPKAHILSLGITKKL